MKFKSMKLALLIPILILLSAFIVNYSVDEEKNGEWSKIYSMGVAYNILEIKDGYIVTGGGESKGRQDFDVFLLKIDKEGNEIWNKSFGGWGDDVGEKVIETEDGYIIGGYTLSYGNGGGRFLDY